MSQRPATNERETTEVRRKLTPEQIQGQMRELQSVLWDLERERVFLLSIVATSKEDNSSGSSWDEPQDAAREDVEKMTLERDYLLREVADKKEENEDLYNTLLDISSEKEQIRGQIEHAKQELEACKSVIDFLVLERDQMKLEISTKDQLLECYSALYNKENMFHFRVPKSKRKWSCFLQQTAIEVSQAILITPLLNRRSQ